MRTLLDGYNVSSKLIHVWLHFLCRLVIGKIICSIKETSINSNLFMLDMNAHIPHLDLKLFSYLMSKPVPRTIFFSNLFQLVPGGLKTGATWHHPRSGDSYRLLHR